ncbi:MAG: hypothetical protein LBM73_03235 [Candidatus Nomurabacteria bacterium]|nr:hypothetical protein [Candidatus Nomurabacteria bacterium]
MRKIRFEIEPELENAKVVIKNSISKSLENYSAKFFDPLVNLVKKYQLSKYDLRKIIKFLDREINLLNSNGDRRLDSIIARAFIGGFIDNHKYGEEVCPPEKDCKKYAVAIRNVEKRIINEWLAKRKPMLAASIRSWIAIVVSVLGVILSFAVPLIISRN